MVMMPHCHKSEAAGYEMKDGETHEFPSGRWTQLSESWKVVPLCNALHSSSPSFFPLQVSSIHLSFILISFIFFFASNHLSSSLFIISNLHFPIFCEFHSSSLQFPLLYLILFKHPPTSPYLPYFHSPYFLFLSTP